MIVNVYAHLVDEMKSKKAFNLLKFDFKANVVPKLVAKTTKAARGWRPTTCLYSIKIVGATGFEPVTSCSQTIPVAAAGDRPEEVRLLPDLCRGVSGALPGGNPRPGRQTPPRGVGGTEEMHLLRVLRGGVPHGGDRPYRTGRGAMTGGVQMAGRFKSIRAQTRR